MFWKTEKQTILEKNRVIVNVWLPRINGRISSTAEFLKAHMRQQTHPNNSAIGHVSIETPNKYASWWPNPQNGEQVGVFNVTGSQNSTYHQDCLSEGEVDPLHPHLRIRRPPDLRVCLYSLNVDEIEHYFTQVESTNFGYVLAGDKKVTRWLNDEKGQSCCGLAYDLLLTGGVLKLSRIYQDLTAKWLIITTDNFAEFVKNAKQKEWAMCPETHNFTQIDNEFIPQPETQSKGWCFIQ